jgi:hypothetical protein
MSFLRVNVQKPMAQRVLVTEDSLVVDLADGRTVTAPLAWYPRLLHGTPKEWTNCDLLVAAKAFIGMTWMRT